MNHASQIQFQFPKCAINRIQHIEDIFVISSLLSLSRNVQWKGCRNHLFTTFCYWKSHKICAPSKGLNYIGESHD